MNTNKTLRTIGRNPDSDLVLENLDVSAVHASVELADNGLMSLSDNDSTQGTFLNRNESWLRIKKITLCIGDRIRFGQHEVPMQQLIAVFGDTSNARLEARHFAAQQNTKGMRSLTPLPGSGPQLKQPVRNPLTGKIEERDKQA